jgi:hypothetical protein
VLVLRQPAGRTVENDAETSFGHEQGSEFQAPRGCPNSAGARKTRVVQLTPPRRAS